jgi:hypothetical protein
MNCLSINIHEENFHSKIEALQWKVGKELLSLGLTVIVEWGTWVEQNEMNYAMKLAR